MTPAEKHKLTAKCGIVYSPSSPVDRLQLFAGRSEQVKQVAKAVTTKGRHAIMYGNRGVGKTSLAMVMREVFADVEGLRVVKVNCVETDKFDTVWVRALAEISIIHEPPADDDDMTVKEYSLDQYVDPNIPLGPGEVRQLLQKVSSPQFLVVLIFDEFDRLDPAYRAHFADAIKDLSDSNVYSTLVLVGVARDVNDLIIEHASISRCLAQIPMPPMSGLELEEIVQKANNQLGMTISGDALNLIVGLSQGLPHYTHLIAQETTYQAIDSGRLDIQMDDVDVGIREALKGVDQILLVTYRKAAEGQRRGTLFPQVMLACALAKTNDLGEFSSVDVRDRLHCITGKRYEIPNFSQHLDKLSTDPTRGMVLEKNGVPRRFRFRFRNPLMRPYILMRGLVDGDINGDLVTNWSGSSDPNSNLLFET